MSKVLIVGGGSEIARALIPMLANCSLKVLMSKDFDVTDVVRLHKISVEKPDFLISFAGVLHPESVVGGSFALWHKQINVNLIGQYNVAYAALQANPKCRIIFIGSTAARKPKAKWSAFCASKAGLVMLTQCLAEEGVDVWCLNVGRMEAASGQSSFTEEDSLTAMKPSYVAQEILHTMNGRRVDRVSWLARD